MADFRNVLTPFGSPLGAPSQLFNIPAPVGAGAAGRFPGLQEGIAALANAISQKKQSDLQEQDRQDVLNFGQQQQTFDQFGQQLQAADLGQQQGLAGLLPEGQAGPGFPAFVPPPQFPQLQSRAGRTGGLELALDQVLGQLDPQRAANLALTKACTKALQTPKPKQRTRSTVLLEQIDKKIASGKLKEGSPQHLRLLGASGDKIKTPEDRLKFWQTVLVKTKDAIGFDLPGQEQTSKLAQEKIQKALSEIDNQGFILPKVDFSKSVSAQTSALDQTGQGRNLNQLAGVATPTTQTEFDAIPKGAEFFDTDGKRKTKR